MNVNKSFQAVRRARFRNSTQNNRNPYLSYSSEFDRYEYLSRVVVEKQG